MDTPTLVWMRQINISPAAKNFHPQPRFHELRLQWLQILLALCRILSFAAMRIAAAEVGNIR
jgi:hypothetical protein